jgi:hypothetical protein
MIQLRVRESDFRQETYSRHCVGKDIFAALNVGLDRHVQEDHFRVAKACNKRACMPVRSGCVTLIGSLRTSRNSNADIAKEWRNMTRTMVRMMV